MLATTSHLDQLSINLGIICGLLVILTAGAIPLMRWLHRHILLPWQALTGAPAEETIDGIPRPSLPQQVRDLAYKQDSMAVTLNDLARVTLPNGNGSVAETVKRIDQHTVGLNQKVDALTARITNLEAASKGPK